ncbi:YtxH domain-containing protein [Staphylococcus massiliensis]|uniref:YtxH domain-containing protein n=1 Tax=Staphylococcus massiliensis TaxID=555791 RepID=UPI001EE10DAA|nr:YtxH domain-containing protein [Staphylococcus massiliensis]MCG3402672.1 YtxH domain-containing protein [Staphylococcus massiliensis]
MQNKLIPGVVIGAIVGGAIALADKNTRQSLKKNYKDIKEGNYAKSNSQGPSKLTQVKDEVLYWKDTIEEIRRNNPELERSIKDAKDTFIERKNNKQIGL